MIHQELCLYHGTNHKVDEEDKTLYLDHKVSKSLGSDKVEIYGSTNFDTSKLASGVSCVHKCIFTGNGAMLAQNPTKNYDQPIVYASRLLNKA
jgi:hypothetical protein